MVDSKINYQISISENDIRQSLTTQGIIQRRRRPKRRSTGIVNFESEVGTLFKFYYFMSLCMEVCMNMNRLHSIRCNSSVVTCCATLSESESIRSIKNCLQT